MGRQSTGTLTGRERVNRCFGHRDHDRVPRYESFWSDTIRRWQAEGLNGDMATVRDLLDADIVQLANPWPAPIGHESVVVAEDSETRTVTDVWGATLRHWKDRMGTPEHHGFHCDSRAIWEREYRDDLQAGAQPPPGVVERMRETYAAARCREQWTCFTGIEGFEFFRRIIGDEVAMMAMIEEPEWIRDLSAVYADVTLAQFEALWNAGIEPDGVWIYGDMAYNHGTLCSPAMYRELVWPEHKRLCDWAHARGIPFIFHTDGDVRGVFPDYQAAGFDAVQPLEAKAGMDIRELAPSYGSEMVLFGNIDIRAMVTDEDAAIEEEIRSKFAAGMAHRGYIYHSDHSVPPQVSWQRYRTILELVDRYGNYD